MSELQNVSTIDGYFRAEDKQLHFTIYDTDGVLIDITGWTITFRMGATLGGTPAITIAATILNQTTDKGECTVTIASAYTTGYAATADVEFYYDLRRTDAGSRTELAYGTITLRETYTNG